MKNTQIKIFMFVLIFIATASSVYAANPVTYTCCNNFTTSNGTLLESFDTTVGWTLLAGTGTDFIDTNNYLEGSASLGINSAFGSNTAYTKTVDYDITNAKNFNIDVYVNESPVNHSRANLSNVIVYMATDAGFTKYFAWQINGATNQGGEFIEGWNHFALNFTEATKTGGPVQTDHVVRLRVRATPLTGSAVNVSFDNLRMNIHARPKAIITFDDGYANVSLHAKPIMDANHQRGVSFVPTALIGTGNKMTLTQLHDLYTSGWDISSHTENHSNLTLLSVNDIDAELDNSKAYLNTNGFTRSSEFFAYPGGAYNYTVLDEVKARYIIARSIKDGLYQPHIYNSTVPRDNTTYLLKIVNIINTTTNSSVITDINNTIEHNGTVILLFHEIVHNGDAINDIDATISNFTTISNYLASRSLDIDVVTFYDYVNINVPNNTPIVGKTVNINSTGLTTVAINNYLNDNTVNISVKPSSNSVNVTVDGWDVNGVDTITINSTEGSNTADITFGDFTPNLPVFFTVDGSLVSTTTADAKGNATYTYVSGLNSQVIQAYTPQTQPFLSSTGYQNLQWWALLIIFIAVIVMALHYKNTKPTLGGIVALAILVIAIGIAVTYIPF